MRSFLKSALGTGLVVSIATAVGSLSVGAAPAQGWSPQRNVEIVVGFVAGGGVDTTARTLKQLLDSNKLVNSSITVVNKPGGGGSIAHAYLSQRPADGHSLMVTGMTLLTNHMMGSSRLNYTDFTLIAWLFNEYIAFSVNVASPIRSGSELTERLKKDPKSVTAGFGAIGGANYLAAAMLHKAIGGNAKNLKGVSFKGGAEAIANLLGGHIDLSTNAAGVVAPHVAAGRLRVVAVAAPTRLGGVFASVPTWKEEGKDIVLSLMRIIIGPKGMSTAQSAYWENALRTVIETAEWRADLERNLWVDKFVTGAQFRKDLDAEYANMKSLLTDLGLAKQ